MSARIVIRSVDGVRTLEFAEPRLTGRNHFGCTAMLVLDGDTSSVGLSMITPYRKMWFDFFRDLADDLDGWQGERTWKSEFSEIAVGFVNDGSGLIEMNVSMWAEGDDDEEGGTLRIRGERVAPCDRIRLRGVHGRAGARLLPVHRYAVWT